MSKNSNKQPVRPNIQATRPDTQQRQQKPSAGTTVPGKEGAAFKKYIHLILASSIAVITWLFLKVCTNNQLTNWDDPGYIKDNPLIKDISSEGLGRIFSTPIMGNYHPLTILSYAIEYSYVRLEPWLYHLDSLLFHIVVTLLVYWFVQLLTRRPVAAAVAALLFGLHPMHMESVAWLAGRKDVVYGMFYMAACVAYVYFLRATGAKRWLLYTSVLLLFLCSLLGKPVAVILPMSLFCIDYFEKRKLDVSVFLDKVPFFIGAVYFGLRSIKDQNAFGSLTTDDLAFNIFERMALGGYALISYLWKAVLPVKLCNFYPYPLKVHGALPLSYYMYPALASVLLALVIYFGRRNKVVIFGTLFFLVNIVLLLQFLPVGGAIIADRYTYIPYLGLFFMAGWLVSRFFEEGAGKQTGYIALSVTLLYAGYLGYLSNERCKVWYDTTSLWRDEIEKEPHDAPNAWNNLGFNYFNKFNESVNPAERKLYYDSATYLLTMAITLQPSFATPYISLGELERTMGKWDDARNHYYKAIALKSFDASPNAYLGLAIIYAINHNFDSSGYYFRKAINEKPHFPEAHSNYGNFFDMTQQPDSALVHYALSIAQNPDMYAPHLNRGRLLYRLKRYDDAIKDFEIAMALNPENGEVYYARSFADVAKGNKPKALEDVKKAISLGFTEAKMDPNYLNMLRTR